MRLSSILRPVVASLALAVPAGAPLVAQPRAESAIRIPFERMTLPNGLNVILAPDRSTPRVTVDVWYHVGSKNEKPGRTGFAHMFEHVMFTGSKNVPYGLHDRMTEGVSGEANNGSTSNDRTNYYETVPPNYLETILWIESDRMGFLLDKLDSAKFVAQRDIVQNERRQRIENAPYGRSFEIITSALFPESHPYSWPVVGYLADLQSATVEDVKQFFRVYYAPSNATLAIVGDFDPAQAKTWVRRYFGDLPRGTPITRPTVAPASLAAPKRLVYEDRVQVPRLYMVWPAVGETDADTYALEYLSNVLTSSRTARLTKMLVYDRQSAARVNAGQAAFQNAGAFLVDATPRPGHSLTELEAQTDSVIERLKAEGPSPAEMAKARAGIEFGFVSGLESNLGKAEILNSGLVFHGNPAYFQTQYAKLTAVTAADVKRVAAKYLGANRIVLSVVPQGKRDQAAKPDASVAVTVSPDGGHYIMEPK